MESIPSGTRNFASLGARARDCVRNYAAHLAWGGLGAKNPAREEAGCDGQLILEDVMHFMVIERLRNQDAKSIYQRVREKGRLMPDGLAFVGSWVEADLRRCFQVMECSDLTLLQRWVAEWADLVEFEIVPVVPGKATAELFASLSKG